MGHLIKHKEGFFDVLGGNEQPVCFSGPISRFSGGAKSFRMWLHSFSKAQSLGFIDNSNLFWDTPLSLLEGWDSSEQEEQSSAGCQLTACDTNRSA